MSLTNTIRPCRGQRSVFLFLFIVFRRVTLLRCLWHSLAQIPFSNTSARRSLSSKLSVRSIPTLVFVDVETGVRISRNGRRDISSQSFLEKFPYGRSKEEEALANLGYFEKWKGAKEAKTWSPKCIGAGSLVSFVGMFSLARRVFSLRSRKSFCLQEHLWGYFCHSYWILKSASSRLTIRCSVCRLVQQPHFCAYIFISSCSFGNCVVFAEYLAVSS